MNYEATMTIEDWNPEARDAIELCRVWAHELAKETPCDMFLFGSAIYESGDQFDAQQSDLDLVVLLEQELSATERVDLLVGLKKMKAKLELRMVPALHRTNCQEPGVSVVPITKTELVANIHKSGARRFFDKNIYLNLGTDKQTIGLTGANTSFIPDEGRQAIELTQKTRKNFLSIGANETGGIEPFTGEDPLPKALARSAAQLVPDVAAGAWYDTRFGLEFIFEELRKQRSDSPRLESLYRKLSIRRGGRGRNQPLDDCDQLLLAEILYDCASLLPLEPMAKWEIRFAGLPSSPSLRRKLIQRLISLIPGAQILGVFDGSVVVQLRSSMSSYQTAERLHQIKALEVFFEVPEVSLSLLVEGAERSHFKHEGKVDLLAERIASWRPKFERGPVREAELEISLFDWLRNDDLLNEAQITRDEFVGNTERQFRADLVVHFPGAMHDAFVAIELVRLRSRASFFRQVERLRRINPPAILVVAGSPSLLKELEEDIQQFLRLDSAFRIVPVQLGKD